MLFLKDQMSKEHEGIMLTGEKYSTQRKTFRCFTLSVRYRTRTSLTLNPGFYDDRPVTNHLNRDTLSV
jgi:hypothetical protein